MLTPTLMGFEFSNAVKYHIFTGKVTFMVYKQPNFVKQNFLFFLFLGNQPPILSLVLTFGRLQTHCFYINKVYIQVSLFFFAVVVIASAVLFSSFSMIASQPAWIDRNVTQTINQIKKRLGMDSILREEKDQ